MAEQDFGSRAVSCLDASALAGLAERVAAATGADRALDAAIMRAMPIPPEGWGSVWPETVTWDSLDAGKWAAPVTASLDAALALVERVLPEAVWEVQRYGGEWRPGYRYAAKVARPYSGKDDHENGRPKGKGDVASTPALALLSALLAALAAGAKDDADG